MNLMLRHISQENVILKQNKTKMKIIMERKEIFGQLNEIFEDVLDLEEAPNLKDETTANDIEEWDSLSHIQLVVAVEKAFKVKFTSSEIMKWQNVGQMVDSILAHV